MPNVRACVHIVNGRGDVKLLAALIHWYFPDKP
jgi:hypothetical protein